MSINQITSQQIESELQAINVQLNALMTRIGLFYTDVVQDIGLSALESAPYSYSSTDAQNIMNAITDMYHFFQVYQGLMYVTAGATQNSGVPTANDGTHFGYPFNLNIAKTGGLGY